MRALGDWITIKKDDCTGETHEWTQRRVPQLRKAISPQVAGVQYLFMTWRLCVHAELFTVSIGQENINTIHKAMSPPAGITVVFPAVYIPVSYYSSKVKVSDVEEAGKGGAGIMGAGLADSCGGCCGE